MYIYFSTGADKIYNHTTSCDVSPVLGATRLCLKGYQWSENSVLALYFSGVLHLKVSMNMGRSIFETIWQPGDQYAIPKCTQISHTLEAMFRSYQYHVH